MYEQADRGLTRMATTSGYDIFQHIQIICAETDLADPATIADTLRSSLTGTQKAEAFDQVATGIVSSYLTRLRSRALSHTEPAPATTGSQAARPLRSRAQRIAGWQDELRVRMIGADGWKTLGEFTAADFTFAASERKRRSDALLASADWLQECQKAVERAKVERFDQLPAAVLAELFTARGEAA